MPTNLLTSLLLLSPVMALNLLKKGKQVVLLDANPASMAKIVEAGFEGRAIVRWELGGLAQSLFFFCFLYFGILFAFFYCGCFFFLFCLLTFPLGPSPPRRPRRWPRARAPW